MGAYNHVSWRGHSFNERTVAALKWAEEHRKVRISPSQGSFNTSVSASGTTHAGGGAVDLSIRGMSSREVQRLVRALKDAGFAAWHRREVPGLWGAHVHAILLGSKDASRAAKWQMAEYLAGRDGLTGRRVDRTYRPSPKVTFDFRKNRPV